MDINNLPLEIFLEILKNVDGKTLAKCRETCKYWKDCIDSTEMLWQEKCESEFKYPSKIAKKKCGSDCTWYHIYKNLQKWSTVATIEKKIDKFYDFHTHDKFHALELNYGVLPLRDSRGVILYDMTTMKYLPVTVPERNCRKLVHNDRVTVLLLKSSLLLQRTVNDPTYMTEAFFKADNFILHTDTLYFFNNRDVFKCDLLTQNLTSKLLLHCDYDIKKIRYNDGTIHIFTDCGKIVNLYKDSRFTVKPMNCPVEWIRQIKHICPLDDKNFVCYSRNLFKIETDKYQHLYLDFPPITALFFYGDLVLIGTRSGEILLYRLSSQKRAIKPIFEELVTLPNGVFAVRLDICERRTGPVIVMTTFKEVYVLQINFFPNENTKATFSNTKMHMFKRLQRIRDRLGTLY